MTTTMITGASSGLGAEMARQLAALGHDLALCARRVERLEEVRAEILRAQPKRTVSIRPLDVNDHEAVFATTRAFVEELGGLDRVVVNAGLGKGRPLGTGGFEANKQTAMTNFVSGLAQVEAAMEHFRERGKGHLVVVSSMSAIRGMPRSMATYAASKAGIAHLAEGLRMELDAKPGLDIDLTVLYPGYIASEMNEQAEQKQPLMVSTEKGVASMVAAIEKRAGSAAVPGWPWKPLSVVMKHAPRGVVRRMV